MTVTIGLGTLLVSIGILSIFLVPIIYGENKCESSLGCIPLLTIITLPFIWFTLALIYIFAS